MAADLSFLPALVGATLRTSEGAFIPTTSVDAAVIGLYFSAHWCPPCRRFSPQLSLIYRQAVQLNKSIEIIFISRDRDEITFGEYHGSMPWLAMPFAEQPRVQELSVKYSVQSIPALIFLNRKGEIIDREARNTVLSQENFVYSLPDKADEALKDSTVHVLLKRLVANESKGNSDKAEGLKTIVRIISNLIQNPGDPKYMSLKKDNVAVQSKLDTAELLEILKIIGFSETKDAFVATENPNLNALKSIREIIQGVIPSFQ
uniref:Transposase n=1 Tax=Nephromyces sp. MMRI TaxID=2496275 RepID=A0A3S8V329_9APIC|nr:transposase [Nephromyces sp. MMRI]AZL94445.1 transposase [Nephromyces sp. MMRI]